MRTILIITSLYFLISCSNDNNGNVTTINSLQMEINNLLKDSKENSKIISSKDTSEIDELSKINKKIIQIYTSSVSMTEKMNSLHLINDSLCKKFVSSKENWVDKIDTVLIGKVFELNCSVNSLFFFYKALSKINMRTFRFKSMEIAIDRKNRSIMDIYYVPRIDSSRTEIIFGTEDSEKDNFIQVTDTNLIVAHYKKNHYQIINKSGSYFKYLFKYKKPDETFHYYPFK